MELLWAAGTRSGSEFALELTSAASRGAGCATRFWPHMRINAARGAKWLGEEQSDISFERVVELSQGMRACKLEEPGSDEWGRDLCTLYPSMRVVGTFRPFYLVCKSHQSLRGTWGFPPEKLLKCYSDNLDFFESIYEDGRVYVFDVTDRKSFRTSRFLHTIGLAPSEEFSRFVAQWPVVNGIEDQKKLVGDGSEPVPFDLTGEDRALVTELERRYRSLVERSNVILGRHISPGPVQTGAYR